MKKKVPLAGTTVEKPVHKLVKAYCAKAEISLTEFYTHAAIKSLPLELIKEKKKTK